MLIAPGVATCGRIAVSWVIMALVIVVMAVDCAVVVPVKATHLDLHVYRSDPELLTRHDLNSDRLAGGAPQYRQITQLRVSPAFQAAHHPGDAVDHQPTASQRRAARRYPPAVGQRVGHDLAQFPDVQIDVSHFAAIRRPIDDASD
jgi:hypothetical protein